MRLRLNPKGRLKDWRRRRLLARHGIGVEVELATFRAGSRSGTWCVASEGLGPESVVYSFGVGDNVDWDLAMIERFGLRVHAFDPTPAARAWIAARGAHPRLHFHPTGIGVRDGTQAFAPIGRGRHFRAVDGLEAAAPGTVSCNVERLATLCSRLGHQSIDVLKLDVEGGEYALVEDLVGAAPRQLLIEFHHRADGSDFARTRDALERLRAAGYRVFHVSRRGLELSLIRARG